jgi:hypothetical protein
MMLRLHRRNLVVWSTSVTPADRYGALRFTRPARTRRIRRRIRTGALLMVIGPVRLVRTVRTYWQAHKRLCELERELAAYSTPAQRCDLEATFDRYPDSVTYELRDILARQAIAAFNNQFPAAGRSGRY